jgi:hypothetical protein
VSVKLNTYCHAGAWLEMIGAILLFRPYSFVAFVDTMYNDLYVIRTFVTRAACFATFRVSDSTGKIKIV